MILEIIVDDIVDSIVDGLKDFFLSLGASLLEFIFTILGFLINIILAPIDLLISSIFPDLTNIINYFNNGLSKLADSPLNYFSYHIPPITRSVLILFLGILISYYTIIWIYRATITIPNVVKKIKFW